MVITLLVLLYVFVEAPTLSPLYLDGAIFWAVLITIYVGLNALMKIGEFSFDAEKTQPGQVPFSFSARQKFPKLSAVIIAVPWILIVVVMILCSVFFQWKAYRDQLGEPEVKKFDSEVQAIDVSQIPIVDEELALQLAQKKLGERPALGSQVALYTATIQMVVIAAAILFAGGIAVGWFVAGGITVGAALTVIILGTDYMTSRITTWLNPWDDPLDKGMQAIQSLMAIGSGGVTGLGLGNGRQKFLYLPEAQNDFIFAVVCEELGLIGACLILLLFALLIIRGYWLALHARDKFGSLIIVGITTLFAFQVFANVAVVTNLFPVTGISLPFFSSGGSALIIQMAEMGLILSISRQNPVT